MRRVFGLAIISAVILGITPPAFAADTSAPVLVDWKLLDLKTDISSSDGKLRVEFSISDDSSILISLPITSLNSQSSTQNSGLHMPILISKVGNLSTFRAEATITFGKAPGLWKWVLVPLRDDLGNSSNGFGPGGNWPVDVWVYDKDFTEAKRLAADAKAAADAELIADKAAADKIIQDAKLEAARILATAKATATKKTTITCTKGKRIKKVTAIKPTCPKGYTKK